MADVTSPEPSTLRKNEPSDATDRGQLFLVGALALAVTFVVLALVMNGVIYTENVSARDLATSTAPAIEYENEAKSVAAHLIADERGGDDYDEMTANVISGLAAWNSATHPFDSVEARIAGIENPTAGPGTALSQDPQDPQDPRSLTDVADTESWTLADGVNTRDAWIATTPSVSESDIENQTYADLTGDDGPFHLNVTVGGEEDLTVFVYEDQDSTDADACVAVFDADSYENSECVASDSIYVDLVDGTYAESMDENGEPMDELPVLERVGEGHTLAFGNGDGATGTYQFVVDAEYSAVEANFGADPDADPYAERALYDVEFQFRYRTENVRYETTVRVAPGEPAYE